MSQPLRIGFIPLSDASPLVLAFEKGFFAEEGLDVELCRENSWSRIRDKVAHGDLDAAHMLAPMVVASAFGVTPIPTSFATAFAFNLNGNGVTVSNRLYEEMAGHGAFAFSDVPSAETLRIIAANRLARGKPPITLAMVYPFSSHNYLLRYWLAHAGLHPDRDVRLIVVPPAEMVNACEAGDIDGYCVGEPWNTVAVQRRVGQQILLGRDIWSAAPEKVLGVRQDWLEQNPETHQRLIRALLRAVTALQTPQRQAEAAHLLAQPHYIGQSEEVLRPSLTGEGVYRASGECYSVQDYTVYDPERASFPWHSKAAWLAVQMIRWGSVKAPGDLLGTLSQSFRTDIFRTAAQTLDLSPPSEDLQPEGGVDGAANRLMDHSVFLSTEPLSYLEASTRHSVRRPLSEVFSG